MKVFVPCDEVLIERLGLNIGDLVPFRLEYRCLHLEDRNDISEMSPISTLDEQPLSLTADLHS